MSAAKNYCDTCECKSCVERRHEEYMNSFVGSEIFVGGRYKLRSLEEFFDKENSTGPLKMRLSSRDSKKGVVSMIVWKFTKVIRAPLCITTSTGISFSVNGNTTHRIHHVSPQRSDRKDVSCRYLDMFEFDMITFTFGSGYVHFNNRDAYFEKINPGYQYWYAPKDYDLSKPPLYYERVDESVSEDASSPVDETKHEDDIVTEDIFDKILEGNKVVHKD